MVFLGVSDLCWGAEGRAEALGYAVCPCRLGPDLGRGADVVAVALVAAVAAAGVVGPCM